MQVLVRDHCAASPAQPAVAAGPAPAPAPAPAAGAAREHSPAPGLFGASLETQDHNVNTVYN